MKSQNGQKVLINNVIIEDLEHLFEQVSPLYLKENLCDMFYAYLIAVRPEDYDPVLQRAAEDFYALFKFLEKAESEIMRIKD